MFFQSDACWETTFLWKWEAIAFCALMRLCGLRTFETRKLKLGDVKFGDGPIAVHFDSSSRRIAT